MNQGQYPTTGEIDLGNGGGTSGTPSTINGVELWGRAGPMAPSQYTATFSAVNLLYQGYGYPLVVKGPANGMGVHNISVTVDAQTLDKGYGVYIICSQYGRFEGLNIIEANLTGLREETETTCTSNSNEFIGTRVRLAEWSTNAVGIGITGTSTSDVYLDTWIDTFVQPTIYSGAQECFYFGPSDSETFYNTTCNSVSSGHSAIALVFDYTVNSNWPSGFSFNHIETSNSTIENLGSPNLFSPNVIYNFSTENGSALPSLANLNIVNGFNLVGPPVPSASGSACAINAQTGGVTTGTWTFNGNCTSSSVTLTFAYTAPTGWACWALDGNTGVVLPQANFTANSAQFTVTSATNGQDAIFHCDPF